MKKQIGCSGFFYWGWKGRFYPEDLKPSEWFRYYSSVFNTVEINSTFYKFPKKSSMKRWFRDSPDDFVFSVKVNKDITHIKRLKDVKNELQDFYNVVSDALKEKTGAFLFQMPPSFRYSKENLTRILESLSPEYLNVVEFRDVSWWNEEVFTVLSQNRIIFCSISAPKLPEKLIKTTDTVYIRFHGKENWYRHDYSEDELKLWADWIKKESPENLFVYFNNDFYAYAPKNALKFKELL
ncbi:DUF72 domain-containing protein [Persephonella sp.]|uniref:DUF72 domain-containing protein n=1 Tax=Persephonella sp. TaxID=2060922 RepID=UPI002603552F|nr:DUF72 domain-containing protein [Persephonella sp.]